MLKNFYIIFILFCVFISLIYTESSKLFFPIQDNYYITSYYGTRKLFGSSFHHGIDIAALEDTNVYAVEKGVVCFVGVTQTGGNTITIVHENGIKSTYCHLSETALVSTNESVNKGQIISTVGPMYLSTGKLNGNTTGPHLHFGLYINSRSVNPLDYF